VKSGDWVKLHYVSSLENGEVIDSSGGLPPVEIKVMGDAGSDGFTDAIIGIAVGEEKEFALKPEQNFGYRDEGKIQEIAISEIKMEAKLEPGMIMMFNFMCGPRMPATILEIKEDAVVVDFNHPLAGKTLKYKVKVLEINEHQTSTYFKYCGLTKK
jgi:FKBP-type peptidyl-prolyl cis-trans isomerase 2